LSSITSYKMRSQYLINCFSGVGCIGNLFLSLLVTEPVLGDISYRAFRALLVNIVCPKKRIFLCYKVPGLIDWHSCYAGA
jgi:hypothetical protein